MSPTLSLNGQGSGASSPAKPLPKPSGASGAAPTRRILNQDAASARRDRSDCNWFFALSGIRYPLVDVRTNTAAPGAFPNPLGRRLWAAGSAGSTHSRSKALQVQRCFQTWNPVTSVEKSSVTSFSGNGRGYYGVARPMAMIPINFPKAKVLHAARHFI